MDLGCRRAPLGEEESNFSIFEGFSVCGTQKKGPELIHNDFLCWFISDCCCWLQHVAHVHLIIFLLYVAAVLVCFLRYEIQTHSHSVYVGRHTFTLYLCIKFMFCSEPPKMWWYRREARQQHKKKKEQKLDTLGGGGGGAEKKLKTRQDGCESFSFFGSKLLCRVACVWEQKKEKNHINFLIFSQARRRLSLVCR